MGLLPLPTKPVTPGVCRTTYHESFTHDHIHQHIAGEYPFAGDLPLAAFVLNFFFFRDEDIKDLILHIHGFNPFGKVHLDFVFITRIGMNYDTIRPGALLSTDGFFFI
jgi:hypothetical protein